MTSPEYIPINIINIYSPFRSLPLSLSLSHPHLFLYLFIVCVFHIYVSTDYPFQLKLHTFVMRVDWRTIYIVIKSDIMFYLIYITLWSSPEIWADACRQGPSQYKDHLFRYGYFHYKDASYLYIPCTDKTTSLYWDTPCLLRIDLLPLLYGMGTCDIISMTS